MRSKLFAIIALAALGFVACGSQQPTVPEVPAPRTTGATPPQIPGPGGPGAEASVSAQDNFFDPDSLSFPAGTEVTIEVTNDGSNPHTFTIDELDVDTGTIGPGISESVTFTMPDSEVTYYCQIHGKSVMFGKLTPS